MPVFSSRWSIMKYYSMKYSEVCSQDIFIAVCDISFFRIFHWVKKICSTHRFVVLGVRWHFGTSWCKVRSRHSWICSGICCAAYFRCLCFFTNPAFILQQSTVFEIQTKPISSATQHIFHEWWKPCINTVCFSTTEPPYSYSACLDQTWDCHARSRLNIDW